MQLPFKSKAKSTDSPARSIDGMSGETAINHGDEKQAATIGDGDDNGKLAYLSFRTIIIGALVSMGGLIFGYDTGQISGFLDMVDFLRRFGEPMDGQYAFSNVRSGTIVGLVSSRP